MRDPISADGDSVDITIPGVGSHGASPQATKDPIVIPAELIVDLHCQSGDGSADPTVITVGSIHAGTKHNNIRDDVPVTLRRSRSLRYAPG